MTGSHPFPVKTPKEEFSPREYWLLLRFLKQKDYIASCKSIRTVQKSEKILASKAKQSSLAGNRRSSFLIFSEIPTGSNKR